MRPPDAQKIGPESVAAEFGAEGIEALPVRVARYSEAKKRALDVAEYMAAGNREQRRVSAQVAGCAEWMAFRHYFTVDLVRLHAARFCKRHLLCPLCAVRRGAKALGAYLTRWEAIRRERPTLRPFLVTLTVRDGDDLAERFRHLHSSQHELWKRRLRRRGSVLDGVAGAVWSYEVKRGRGSGQWHPHLHMIALAEVEPDAERLAHEWLDITGDSHVVDVRPIQQDDEASGFAEVFKYAVKFSDMDPADTVHAAEVLAGRRLVASSGCFLGVQIPDDLADEPLDGLPYVELLFRFVSGAGYSAAGQSARLPAAPRSRASAFVRLMTAPARVARGYGGG